MPSAACQHSLALKSAQPYRASETTVEPATVCVLASSTQQWPLRSIDGAWKVSSALEVPCVLSVQSKYGNYERSPTATLIINGFLCRKRYFMTGAARGTLRALSHTIRDQSPPPPPPLCRQQYTAITPTHSAIFLGHTMFPISIFLGRCREYMSTVNLGAYSIIDASM